MRVPVVVGSRGIGWQRAPLERTPRASKLGYVFGVPQGWHGQASETWWC